MRLTIFAAALAALPAVSFAQDDGTIPQETVAQIEEMLAGLNCQMDLDDIETTEEGGYDLDDVMCEDGQYDIELNADMEEVSRRAE